MYEIISASFDQDVSVIIHVRFIVDRYHTSVTYADFTQGTQEGKDILKFTMENLIKQLWEGSTRGKLVVLSQGSLFTDCLIGIAGQLSVS